MRTTKLTYLSGLRSTILAILSDSLDSPGISGLISLSHAMAIQMLRSKSKSGYIANAGGLNEADLAMDCIADLFRRDEKGSYVALRAYFGSLAIGSASDEELTVHLRRLVSSTVNQGMFRLLRDLDPGLGKIIRNIKLGIDSLKTFNDLEVRGEVCMVPTLVDPLLHLPFMEREELLGRLAEHISGKKKTPVLLASLAVILRSQSTCTRAIPVVRAALAFRDLLALQEEQTDRASHPPQHGHEDAVRRAIECACQDVRTRVTQKYTKVKEVPAPVLNSYFDAVRHFFLARLDSEGDGPTLYDSLRAVGSVMTQEEYRKHHRQRMEYIVRLVRDGVKEHMDD